MKKTPQPAQAPNGALQGYERFKHVMGIVITWLYHLRKVVLTAPVVYVALRLALTGGCLAMMFLSRKALYAWAVSVFSLALPVLLVVSNLYPA